MQIIAGIMQIPEHWPVVTREALIVGIIVFALVTIIAWVITHSRWSWLPGIIFGVIAAVAWTASTPSAQALASMLGILRIMFRLYS
jgi:hypothetical protein